MRTLLCVCPPRMESLLPPVLSKSCSQIPQPSKSYSLGIPPPIAIFPVGKPDVGLRTFTPVCGPLWYKCSPVCESPTPWPGDLILLWLRPSYHLIVAVPLFLDVVHLLWWVPVSSVLLMSVQQLVVILVLSQDGVSTRPSTLPSWTNLTKQTLSSLFLYSYALLCLLFCICYWLRATCTCDTLPTIGECK